MDELDQTLGNASLTARKAISELGNASLAAPERPGSSRHPRPQWQSAQNARSAFAANAGAWPWHSAQPFSMSTTWKLWGKSPRAVG